MGATKWLKHEISSPAKDRLFRLTGAGDRYPEISFKITAAIHKQIVVRNCKPVFG